MKKVKHNQRFFIINHEGFSFRNSDHIKKQTGEDTVYCQYYWVIPMYVYSINSVYDGSETFDLCPVDCYTMNGKNNWKWRRSFEYEEIGKTIFNTEKEAQDMFNKTYSEDQKKVFTETRRLRFIQEKDSKLI